MAGAAGTPTLVFMKERKVEIPAHPVTIAADLVFPDRPEGVIVFAHGSGSSRLSPRNRQVAIQLNQAGFATLLLDLLTPEEELDRRNAFDVDLLTQRLLSATRWLQGARPPSRCRSATSEPRPVPPPRSAPRPCSARRLAPWSAAAAAPTWPAARCV